MGFRMYFLLRNKFYHLLGIFVSNIKIKDFRLLLMDVVVFEGGGRRLVIAMLSHLKRVIDNK